MANQRKIRSAKLFAAGIFSLAALFFITAMIVHEQWENAIFGWLVGFFYAALGIFTIYNFLVGPHRGHVVYMRMLWVYLAIASIFLIRSFGLLLGPAYWIVGASLVFLLWLVIRPYKDQIQRERRLGISKDYFLEY